MKKYPLQEKVRRMLSGGLAAVFVAVAFTGCSIPSMIGSVDTMLVPPRLTDDQNDIYDALTAHLSGDGMHLVYPQKGENLSAFILCNLDHDLSNEAVVFYQLATSSTAAVPITMAVLDMVSESWQVVSETTLEGSAVEDVTLLSVDGVQMLAVGLSYAGENGSSLLDIFSLQGGEMQLVSSKAYQAKALGDLTGSGSDDLLLIYTQEDSEGQTGVQAGLFQWDSSYSEDGFQLAGSCDVNPEMTRYQQLSVSTDAEGAKLYLDGYRGNFMITEVLSCTVRDGTVQLLNRTWTQGASPDYPQRASLVSMDGDGDGTIEVPGQTILPGYTEEDEEILYLTQWYRQVGRRFVPDYAAYVNSLLNYQFIFPESWVGNVSAYRNNSRNEITFIEWNENTEEDILSLFSLRAVNSAGWRAGKISSEYQMVASRGQIVFLARVFDTDSEYALTLEEIRQQFCDLG